MNENRKAPAPPRRKRRRRPGKFRRALHALSRAVLLLLLTAVLSAAFAIVKILLLAFLLPGHFHANFLLGILA